MKRIALLALLLPLAVGAYAASAPKTPPNPTIGEISAYDTRFNALVPRGEKIEQIAQGFTWAEGPTWVKQCACLLFTDVPENTLYRWSPREGASVLLKPSGYAGKAELATLSQPGANGLSAQRDGTVLLADSGSRALMRLDPVTKTKTVLAARFEGKRFNSPNDVIRHDSGAIFFTDPTYGLKDGDKSPVRELPFSGVYRLGTDGKVTLVDKDLAYPNGVALSPDQRTLYVSNSDPARPIWMAYSLDADGNVTDKRVFADASDLVGADNPGLPDGIAVAVGGVLFATGPGGVLVMDANGKRLGLIATGGPVSNVAFGDDGMLYLTSNHLLARVRVNARGVE